MNVAFHLACGMVSCCEEVGHMTDTVKLHYNRFYTPLPKEESEQENKSCH